MQHTEALRIYELVESTREQFLQEPDFFKRRKLYRRLKKYQQMYDKIVSEEAHREIVQLGELRTRGY